MKMMAPFEMPLEFLQVTTGSSIFIVSFDERKLAVRLWPPAVWQKNGNAPWQPYREPCTFYDTKMTWQSERLTSDLYRATSIETRLYEPDFEECGRRAQRSIDESIRLSRILKNVPETVDSCLQRFDVQLPVALGLHHLGAPFQQLCETNPALAYWLADEGLCQNKVEQQALYNALRTSGFRQRNLLRFVGLPEAQTYVNMLKKFTTRAISRKGFALFRELILKREAFRLCQLPAITAETLLLLNRPYGRIFGNRFFIEITRDDDSMRRLRLKLDMQNLDRLWPILTRHGLALRFETFGALRNFLDSYQSYRQIRHIPFPICPLAPPDSSLKVEPVLNGEELARESRELKNCALTYLPQALQGNVCFFRVIAPARATLCLERDNHGYYRLTELSMREPFKKKQVEDACRKWLTASQRPTMESSSHRGEGEASAPIGMLPDGYELNSECFIEENPFDL